MTSSRFVRSATLAMLLGVASPAAAADSPSLASIMSAIGDTIMNFCLNPPIFECYCPPCWWCPTKASSTGSSIDNVNFAYDHWADDYLVSKPGVACGSCNTSTVLPTGNDVPSLRIRRHHRPRDVSYPSSFGPGVFQNFDLSLQLFTTATGERYVDFFSTEQNIASRFFDGPWSNNSYGYTDPSDGIYKDLVHNTYKQLRLFDANGLVTTSHASAVTAQIDGHDGNVWKFQIINLDGGVRAGRLTTVIDAKGYMTTVAYAYQSTDDLMGSQARLWQIATITDAQSNVASFHYATAQVSGRWVVDQITLPTGAVITYQYAGGNLSGVSHPDGTASTFAFSYNTTTKCTVIGIDDATAETTHRRKSVHVTTNYILAPSPDGNFFPQSAQIVRLVLDAAGEPVYFNIPHPWGTAAYVYEGGNAMKYVAYDMWNGEIASYGRKAKSWSMSKTDPVAPWAWSNFSMSFETGFRVATFSNTDSQKGLYRNQPTWSRDENNQVVVYDGFGTPGRFLKRTFPDGTFEKRAFDALDRETLYVDRLGRVIAQTFDAVGNRLTRTTGSTWDAVNNVVVATTDTATESWEYIPAGQTNQYRIAAQIDARGNRTDYAYDNRGRPLTVTGPADEVGGPRPVTTFEYDNASRLTKVIEPTVTKWVAYGYDGRSRVATVTYADSSTETTTFGTGQDANLVAQTKDRNGNITVFVYDAIGRKIQETISGPTGPVLRTRTFTYRVGTDVVDSVTDNGETTSYTLDYAQRPIATIRKPKVGTALTESSPLDSLNRNLGTIDAYGRKSWNAYNANHQITRVVHELVPGAVAGVPTDDAARSTFLLALARPSGANPGYIVEDTAYDVEGQVSSRTDAAGTVTTFAYTNRGQLASQTEAFGTPVAATTTFIYDEAGNRLTATGPRSTTAMTYTGRNLVAEVTEAHGTGESTLVRSLTYTPTKKVESETDALGRTTAFDYGLCCDRLKMITDPAGFQTQFLFDFNGNRTTVTDANGLTSITVFDGLNRPVSSSNAAIETTVMVYDENLTDGVGIDAIPAVAVVLPGLGLGAGADGSAVAATNPKGEMAYELRDGLGRPVARIDPLGNATRIAYDTVVSGLVETTQTDALNHTTKVCTDAAGRARIQVDALGNQSQSGFSADGDQVSQIDAMGLGWSAVYDERHRLKSRTSTRANATETTSWTYDLDGNRLTETDALLKTETSTFDLRNRRTVLVDRLNGTTRFVYDAVGNLLTISDAENEVRSATANPADPAGLTRYAYNSRDLLVAEAFPSGQAGVTLRTYTYDGGRRVTARQVGILSGVFSATPAFSGSPEVTIYDYDAANRLVTRGYADAKNDTFVYDPASRLTSAISARYATTVGRVYDAAGRLTSESLTLPDGTLTGTVVGPATYTVGYGYDAANRTTGITYPTGTQVVRTYTNRNELVSVSMGGSPVAIRSYDASGRLISTAFGNGVTESRTYVPGSLLVATIAAAPAVGPAVTGFSLTYDAAGRKLTEDNSAASNQAFGYDFAGRLIDWKKGPTAAPTATQTWDLSLVGDWNSTHRDGVAETRQNTWVHEAVQVGTNLLTYDTKGNLTKDEKQTVLAWDPENRLVSARVTPDASVTGLGAYATYRYDALGRRIAKTVQSQTTLFLNAGAQTVVELERTAIPTQAQINGAESDGTAAQASLTPASGGILPAGANRINFQPETTAIPAGFYADKGRTYAVRTNGLSYGWAATDLPQPVARQSASLVEFDTHAHLQQLTAFDAGLRGTYYDNKDYTGPVQQRLDATVGFNWASGAPVPGIGIDTFSVHWHGRVTIPTGGSWTFTTSSDDGVRLLIDGAAVINNWTDHGATLNNGTLTLTAGEHAVQMDFYENGGLAVAQLLWAGPGVTQQIIPVTALSTPKVHTWEMALPNGVYPVIVVCGDPTSLAQTNNIIVEGQALKDLDPGTAATVPGYEQGDFDGYAILATVTDGKLTVAAGDGAYDPKMCFIEVGEAGAGINQATLDRLAALILKMTTQTGAAPDPINTVREYAYQTYMDEVLAFQTTTGVVSSRYYPHANHLYSVAALTNAAGQVVERYTYDAYGKQTITAPVGGVVRAKSSVGWDRGFTGYVADNETGWCCARTRMYSPTLGRFVNRDSVRRSGFFPSAKDGYRDGLNSYLAYFIPNALDPIGTEERNPPVVPPPPPPVFPDPDKVKPLDSYNCAGLAFRNYRMYGSAGEIQKALQASSPTGAANKSCDVKCNCTQIKCWFWTYEVSRYWSDGSGDLLPDEMAQMGLTGVPSRYTDVHIVCGQVAGNDPTQPGPDPKVYSKAGAGPIEGPKDAADFTPKMGKWDTQKGDANATIIYERAKLKVDCYCLDPKSLPK